MILSIRAVDKTYLTELVRDVPPFLGPKSKTYYNRDLKPGRWDEIREKLNFTISTEIITLMNDSTALTSSKYNIHQQKFILTNIVRRVYHVPYSKETEKKKSFCRKKSGQTCRIKSSRTSMEIDAQTSVGLLCCVGSGPNICLSLRRIRDPAESTDARLLCLLCVVQVAATSATS
jgi:hypothetical protein